MEAIEAHLRKIREERLAREKARIDKLREMNLKKYKSESNINMTKSVTKPPLPTGLKVTTKPNLTASRPSTAPRLTDMTKSVSHLTKSISVSAKNITAIPKSNPSLNKNVATSKKMTVNALSKNVPSLKTITTTNKNKSSPTANKTIPDVTKNVPIHNKPLESKSQEIKRPHSAKFIEKPKTRVVTDIPKAHVKPMSRKSLAPAPKAETIQRGRKSMLPTLARPQTTATESVFDRLYKPKTAVSHQNVKRTLQDKSLRDKAIRESNLLFKGGQKILPVRRSISAVHLKLIPKHELANCFHKWASIDDLNHLKENEDDSVKEDRVISAVKSERKKVKFQKPISINFNTPKPEELQQRLQSWLQKRGKSINSYHHLQCFGLHHLSKDLKAPFDDENKENVALENDSDNESYCDAVNQVEESAKWRRASYSSDLDETQESLVVEDNVHTQNELLAGALNDLTELLREGFDWQQCARWLRAVRERLPRAGDCAAYWECRAALEERQGNLPASVHCWEEAIAKGTDRSVVEANLDQLLDKFMQLKISPSSTKKQPVSARMLDVKNVFKSTIIRFAVQQAKLRKSTQHNPVEYFVTPVRRSNRLSGVSLKTPRLLVKTPTTKRTPLVQICSSLRHIDETLSSKPVFVPNQTLPCTP